MAITKCQLCCSLRKSQDITKNIVSAVFRNIGRKINPDNSICRRCASINLKWFKYMNQIKETADKDDVNRTHSFHSVVTDSQKTNNEKRNEYKTFRERLKKNFSCMIEGNSNLYENLENNESEKENKKSRKKHKEYNKKETIVEAENPSVMRKSIKQTSARVQATDSNITFDEDDITIIKDEESIQHLDDQIPQKNEVVTCGSCLVSCTGKEAFELHLRSAEHLSSIQNDEKITENLYTCCGCSKQFKKSNLKHMRRCLNLSKERICSVCLEILGDMDELKIHRETHKKYTCSVCSESFSTVLSLKKHKRGVHSKILTDLRRKILPQMRSCEFCGKEYLKQGMLNNHLLKSHPYSCSLCKGSFSNAGNLNRHLRVVHMRNTDVNFTDMIKCEYCGGRFQNKQCLDAHKCAENPRYTCKRCKGRFNSILCYHKHKERCGRLKSVTLTHQQSSQNYCSQGNLMSKIQNRTRGVFRKRETIADKSNKLIVKKGVKITDGGNTSTKCKIKASEKILKKTIENITKPLNGFEEDVEFVEVTKNGLKKVSGGATKNIVEKSGKSTLKAKKKSRKEAVPKKDLNKIPAKVVNNKKVDRIDECENCKNIFTSEDLIRHLPLCLRFEIVTSDADTYRKCESCSMLFSSLLEIHDHSARCKYKPASPRQDVRVNEESSTYDQHLMSKNKSIHSRSEILINEEPEISPLNEYPKSNNRLSALWQESRPKYSKYPVKTYGSHVNNRWNERTPFSSTNRERNIPSLLPYNTFHRSSYGSHYYKNPSYSSSYRRDY